MLRAYTIHSDETATFSKLFNDFLDEKHLTYKQIKDVKFKSTSTTLGGDFYTRAYTDYVALILYETNDGYAN